MDGSNKRGSKVASKKDFLSGNIYHDDIARIKGAGGLEVDMVSRV